jgi:hypothetical protein
MLIYHTMKYAFVSLFACVCWPPANSSSKSEPSAQNSPRWQLDDYEFDHSLRSGNTAADWLANKAMDDRQSTSSLTSEITDYTTTMTNLTQRVDHDTMHVYSETTHPHDVLTSIRTAAAKHGHHDLPSRKRPRPIEPHQSRKHSNRRIRYFNIYSIARHTCL